MSFIPDITVFIIINNINLNIFYFFKDRINFIIKKNNFQLVRLQEMSDIFKSRSELEKTYSNNLQLLAKRVSKMCEEDDE